MPRLHCQMRLARMRQLHQYEQKCEYAAYQQEQDCQRKAGAKIVIVAPDNDKKRESARSHKPDGSG